MNQKGNGGFASQTLNFCQEEDLPYLPHSNVGKSLLNPKLTLNGFTGFKLKVFHGFL